MRKQQYDARHARIASKEADAMSKTSSPSHWTNAIVALGLCVGAGGGWMLATSSPAEDVPTTAFAPLPTGEETAVAAVAKNDVQAASVAAPAAASVAVAPAVEKTPAAAAEAEPTAAPAVAANAAAPVVVAAAQPAPQLPTLQKRSITDRVRPGETLSVALTRHGVTMDDVNLLVAGLKGKLDVRGIRPGDSYTVEQVRFTSSEDNKDHGLAMDVFKFRPAGVLGVPTVVRAAKKVDGSGYDVEEQTAKVTTKLASVQGTVNSSLYVSMTQQGEGPTLVNRFVDVFGWDVDFYREAQRGDTYKAIVEKKYAEGRFVGYGKVLAAEYVNAGHQYRGFNFVSKDEKVRGLFTQEGRAMEKTFLKNPMEIARVTSSYGQRFHPVLRRMKKHNGVDYGAPRGTPFWAVADGTVVKAHYSRTAGNMIVLRHNNGYTTEYFHATRFAKGIKVGAKVKQRQVIAYVGNTGRSTGPHLHFGMRKNGGHVNPAKQRFPAAKPVPKAYRAEYKEAIQDLLAELEAMENS